MADIDPEAPLDPLAPSPGLVGAPPKKYGIHGCRLGGYFDQKGATKGPNSYFNSAPAMSGLFGFADTREFFDFIRQDDIASFFETYKAAYLSYFGCDASAGSPTLKVERIISLRHSAFWEILQTRFPEEPALTKAALLQHFDPGNASNNDIVQYVALIACRTLIRICDDHFMPFAPAGDIFDPDNILRAVNLLKYVRKLSKDERSEAKRQTPGKAVAPHIYPLAYSEITSTQRQDTQYREEPLTGTAPEQSRQLQARATKDDILRKFATYTAGTTTGAETDREKARQKVYEIISTQLPDDLPKLPPLDKQQAMQTLQYLFQHVQVAQGPGKESWLGDAAPLPAADTADQELQRKLIGAADEMVTTARIATGAEDPDVDAFYKDRPQIAMQTARAPAYAQACAALKLAPDQPSLLQRLGAPTVSADPTQPLPGPLEKHQITGIAWLQGRESTRIDNAPLKGAILMDETGLGKTRLALENVALSAVKHEESDHAGEYYPIFIIVPGATIANWARELRSSILKIPGFKLRILHGHQPSAPDDPRYGLNIELADLLVQMKHQSGEWHHTKPAAGRLIVLTSYQTISARTLVDIRDASLAYQRVFGTPHPEWDQGTVLPLHSNEVDEADVVDEADAVGQDNDDSEDEFVDANETMNQRDESGIHANRNNDRPNDDQAHTNEDQRNDTAVSFSSDFGAHRNLTPQPCPRLLTVAQQFYAKNDISGWREYYKQVHIMRRARPSYTRRTAQQLTEVERAWQVTGQVDRAAQEVRRCWHSLFADCASYLLLDEAHAVKSPYAQQTIAARLLNARFNTLITATPVANRISDLYSQLLFTVPEGMSSARKWLNRTSEEIMQWLNDLDEDDPAILDPDLLLAACSNGLLNVNLSHMLIPRIMGYVALRRSIGDALPLDSTKPQGEDNAERIARNIPGHIIAQVELWPESRQYPLLQSAHAHALRQQRQKGVDDPSGNAGRIDGGLVRITQLAAFSTALERYRMTLPDGERYDMTKREDIDRYIAMHDHGFYWLMHCATRDEFLPPRAITAPQQMIEFLANHSPKQRYLCGILRFHFFARRESLIILHEWPASAWLTFIMLKLLNIPTHFVVGSDSDSKRLDIYNRFTTDSDPSVLVSTTAILGQSLNLHERCHTMVIMEVPRNWAALLQAVGRIKRLGQTKEQVIYHLCLRHSLDTFRHYNNNQKFSSIAAAGDEALWNTVVARQAASADPDAATDPAAIKTVARLMCYLLGQEESTWRPQCSRFDDFGLHEDGTPDEEFYAPNLDWDALDVGVRGRFNHPHHGRQFTFPCLPCRLLNKQCIRSTTTPVHCSACSRESVLAAVCGFYCNIHLQFVSALILVLCTRAVELADAPPDCHPPRSTRAVAAFLRSQDSTWITAIVTRALELLAICTKSLECPDCKQFVSEQEYLASRPAVLRPTTDPVSPTDPTNPDSSSAAAPPPPPPAPPAAPYTFSPIGSRCLSCASRDSTACTQATGKACAECQASATPCYVLCSKHAVGLPIPDGTLDDDSVTTIFHQALVQLATECAHSPGGRCRVYHPPGITDGEENSVHTENRPGATTSDVHPILPAPPTNTDSQPQVRRATSTDPSPLSTPARSLTPASPAPPTPPGPSALAEPTLGESNPASGNTLPPTLADSAPPATKHSKRKGSDAGSTKQRKRPRRDPVATVGADVQPLRQTRSQAAAARHAATRNT